MVSSSLIDRFFHRTYKYDPTNTAIQSQWNYFQSPGDFPYQSLENRLDWHSHTIRATTITEHTF